MAFGISNRNGYWTITACLLLKLVNEVKGWNFIVFADWHGGEKWAVDGLNEDQSKWKSKEVGDFSTIQYIHDTFGGDLLMMPGDTQGGHWDEEKHIILLPPQYNTPAKAVKYSCEKVYDSMLRMFKMAGYSKVLMTVGDHELGGNAWPAGSVHLDVMPYFREGFAKSFNTNQQDKFKWSKPINGVQPRPYGTPYASTSFAHIHKNVMFVTVDVFHNVDGQDFYDTSKGHGGEGAVTCTVTGKHLKWFDNILKAGAALRDNKGTIDHIIVQAHDPVLYPVRRINSSGQFFDGAEHSAFWKAMRKYKVDLYFAGEVHDNTVSKDPYPGSNLVQVVSRANGFNNFLNMKISKTKIVIDNYNEVGDKPKYNNSYQRKGRLTINKKNKNTTKFKHTGTLKFIDKSKPILHFTFDKLFSIKKRQVLGLHHEDEDTQLLAERVNVRGKICTQSLPNMGVFGQQYDAQACLELVKGNKLQAANGKTYTTTGSVANFMWNSHVGVWGMGPHSNGEIVSYTVWVKTDTCKDQVILTYASIFANRKDSSRTSQFSLVQHNGRPAVLFDAETTLTTTRVPQICETGTWNHIAVTMPRKSCTISEVQIYINGEQVDTLIDQKDRNIYFNTRGRVSIGGWGHAGEFFSTMGYKDYIGLMEEVRVYARTLTKKDIDESMGVTSKSFKINYNTRCKLFNMKVILYRRAKFAKQCENLCANNANCYGYEALYQKSNQDQPFLCKLFDNEPANQNGTFEKSQCGVVV
eukprot:CAMPEP_0184854838 /NCGR_PEP_ID=MMETSP0580-20130426/220_1 /TAXON_ID=1118495 /ORGANISM="Dactyliosolen fragilissimus" /LENGTH=748 /DNA_ID=CAMNT_0027349183 /DNA_START=20 /DNA_END=2266 /DNA_ORIENTATION=+